MKRRAASAGWVLEIEPFVVTLNGCTVRIYGGGEQPLQVIFSDSRAGAILATEQYLERIARGLTLYSPCQECAERFAKELSDIARR